MAKGFNKDGFEIISWELKRGFARRGGFKIWDAASKELGKRILDGNSPFRKLMNRFTLPGTYTSAKNKMYTLIDAFYNEYVTTKAMLQKTMYLQDDIEFIERKLKFVERLIDTDVQERSYERLVSDWMDYKQQSLNS